ncbi:MAG: HAD family phosphatase [Roseicyclus sp.]|uniref:HAD family hydrolase n=1 Tax=Boseongicola sp. H5 TaxID=2763261 RepID=UPI001B2CB232|nr:HAD family phosphatase [Boseongicola sp. H5]MBO6601657.1 HAD family phosphatase [Roseicyclus sp.]MBO6624163.1 HAD family phosphatase [Roseicyclus sp.]MBO6920825.1 HAD family phosphatase [Roseicyclus sp.]
MTIDAVIFDIGNVLIEWQPERFYDREIGEARRRALFDAVDLHAMNERVDLGHGFQDVIYETAARYPDFATEIRMWHDRWIELAQPVIPHSVKLLRALRARGVPVFALTNFGIESYAYAQTQFDFLNEFDQEYVSGRMRVTKPDPRIYELVEEQSGVAPQNLLFADDRAANISAARVRGWKAHLFEGPAGWADALVMHDLLSPEEAAA